jgi:uncharacterized protein YbjQ (UPF0145 family)
MDLNKPGPLYDAMREKIRREVADLTRRMEGQLAAYADLERRHEALARVVGPAKDSGAKAVVRITDLERTVAEHEKRIVALALAKARPAKAPKPATLTDPPKRTRPSRAKPAGKP